MSDWKQDLSEAVRQRLHAQSAGNASKKADKPKPKQRGKPKPCPHCGKLP